MPSIPPVNAVISRIDAPFPEQWRAPLEDFKNELKAIQNTLGVMSVTQVEALEAQKALVDLYSAEALEQRASQAKAQEQPQQRLPNEQGGLPGASRAGEALILQPPPGSPGADREQREEEERARSRPPDAPDTKLPEILEKPIEMPAHYGGRYTAQDAITLMGKLALSKKFPLGSESQGIALGKFAEKTLPNAEAAINLGRTYVDQARSISSGLQSYSGSLGYQPGAGTSVLGMNQNDLNIGPFSFRTPFSSGALAGLGSMTDAYTEAMTVPGLSGAQNAQMWQSLTERGWFPEQRQTQELLDAQHKLFGRGGAFQELSENPEVMDMMDKATRSGTTSTKEMVEIIEEIPKAAEGAHEGIQQMVADMKAYGEFSESQGGTNLAGYKQAQAIATSTGLPAAASMGLLNSPWTQSVLFRETGMPSYVQGALPGGVKNAAAMKGFFEAARTVGNFKPYKVKNPVSGGYETVSSLSQKAAFMHKFQYPEMSIEQIEKRLRMGTAPIKREQTLSALEQWRNDAKGMIARGANPEKISAFISGGEEGQMPEGFGHILSSMLDMKTADGKPMFSHQDIKQIRAAGQGLHNNQLVEAKYKEAKRILRTKAEKQSNNSGSPSHSVMIELGPEARRLLRLPNRKTRMKLETNAGGPEPINHSAVGAQDYLTPQPGTHPVVNNFTGEYEWVPNE